MTSFSRAWGAGDDILALHCSLASSAAWDGVGRALAHRARLTAPDLVGHGRGPDRDPTFDFHDQSTWAAAKHLPFGPCHLIGHSFGATVALRLALDHPDRVRSLTMIEPVLFAAAPDSDGVRAEAEALAGFSGLLAGGHRADATRLFLSYWGDQPLDAMGEAQARKMIDRIWAVDAAQPALRRDGAGLLPRFGALTCPVLLLEGGASPPAIADILTALGARIPGHRRAVIAGAGHMVPITHPEQVAAEIERFLDAI